MHRIASVISGALLAASCVVWAWVAHDLANGVTTGLAGVLASATRGASVSAEDVWASAMRRAVFLLIVFSAPFVFPRLRAQLEGYGGRFVGDATAESVALLRIVVAGTLLVSALVEDLPSIARLPVSSMRPMGIIALLTSVPCVAELARNEGALEVLALTTRVLLLLAALGVRGRFSVPAAAVAYLLFGGLLRAYTKLFHTGLVPLFMLLALSFFPTTDAWSFDRVLGGRGRAVDVNAPSRLRLYGWARYTAVGGLAVAYFAAGASKLLNGGPLWWHPDNLRTILATDGMSPMAFDWGLALPLARGPRLPLALAGIATIVLELGMLTTLSSARARRLLPAAMAMMHVGIFFAQNVLFLDLIVLDLAIYALVITDGRLPRPSVFWHGASPVSEPVASDRGGRVLAVLAGALLIANALAIEAYPLTAMQMYSRRNRDGVVRYHRLVALDTQGVAHPVHPEALAGVLRDSRHRFIVARCFDGTDRAPCEDFLRALGEHVTRVSRATHVVAIEAQSWRWHFLRTPHDPRHGVIDACVRVDLLSARGAGPDRVSPPLRHARAR